jgi:hypothetical protein
MLEQNPCRPDPALRARGGPDPVRRAPAFRAGADLAVHRRVAATTYLPQSQELEAIMTDVRGPLCIAGRLGG